MNHLVRSILAKALLFKSASLSGATVLCYHSVGDNTAPFTVTRAVFEKQMAYLAAHTTPISLSELYRRLINKESVAGCSCVTFDDGYKDNLTTALPVLQKYNVPASVFVITSKIGQTFTHSKGQVLDLMSADDLRAIQKSGLVELYPHTHTHPDVRDIPQSAYEHEFEDARKILEEVTGVPVLKVLAYPKGRSNDAVHAWLQEQSWLMAFGTKGGIVTPNTAIYDVFRNGIRNTTTWSEFRLMLTDGVEAFEKLRSWRM